MDMEGNIMKCDQCEKDYFFLDLIWNYRYRITHTIQYVVRGKVYFKELKRKMLICQECFESGQFIDGKIYKGNNNP